MMKHYTNLWLLYFTLLPAKAAEPIEMLFGLSIGLKISLRLKHVPALTCEVFGNCCAALMSV